VSCVTAVTTQATDNRAMLGGGRKGGAEFAGPENERPKRQENARPGKCQTKSQF